MKNSSKEKQIKNIGIYFIPNIFTVALPLLHLPIVLRHLSPQEYGVYTVSLGLASIFLSFSGFSLLDVYERNFFLHKEENINARLLFTIVSFAIVSFFLFGSVLYFLKGIVPYLFFGLKINFNLFLIVFFGLGFKTIMLFYLVYLKNLGNSSFHVSINLACSFLSVVFDLLFVVILKVGVIGLSYSLLISNFIIFLFLSLYFVIKKGYSFRLKLLIESLKISIPLIPKSLLTVFGKQFDKYFLGIIVSMGSAGIYSISQRISNFSFLLMGTLQKVYSPIVYDKMFNDPSIKGSRDIGLLLTPYAYLTVSSGVVISIFSEEVLMVLAPPEYISGANVINILCVALSLGFFTKQPQLMYAAKTRLITGLSFLNFLFTIIFLYIFIHNYGVLGAAIAYLISSFIYNVLYLWQGQKHYKIDYEWGKIFLIYFSIFFISISILILNLLSVSYVYRLGIKLIFLICFLFLGYSLNIITRSNFDLIFKKSHG